MLQRLSPCKVNFLLNILGKREDGYHELETLFHPVPLTDELTFTLDSESLQMTCSLPGLPCDDTNLVVRAARYFFQAVPTLAPKVRIHLEKRIPLAAGLGGGSGNAAHTLLGLNELFGSPLALPELHRLAAGLGSDVNFFLETGPALATGRGENTVTLAPFEALKGCAIFLFHPGFGVATAWAFKALGQYPEALRGVPGRAARLADTLRKGDLQEAGRQMYNSLETPVLVKYPVLQLYQEFLRKHGAFGALMSGSGSTTFALFNSLAQAQAAVEPFRASFGNAGWLQVVEM
ncbi:MAG TPA: 4-(cytidine 5'-diphospho)-2-C-methyl-D-erythritol kinase [Candidatus Limnocylindria bacterium]|nr:4-(cytidine 5'-diphospho)-2-C-methyl-D-erythritol kinase [Candidatus Limnocylindria bacterium]